MLKKLLIIFTAICLMSGCFARRELRPQRNSEEIWVCKEIEDTYFYWDEDSDCFMGTITYAQETMEFVLGGGSGLGVSFYYSNTLKQDDFYPEKDRFIHGFADYQQGVMPVKIDEDKLNILKGEIDTLTFIPQDRKEYFEDTETNR